MTGINTTGLRIGVSGGNRGGVQAVSTADYSAAYKGIGIETSVDFEAQYAGMGFDDVKAIGAKVGLEACMLGEELLILGGDTSVALGTTPTPTLVPSTTGGSLTAAASPYSVICAALTLDGVVNGSIAGGVQGAITRSNADGSSDTFGGGAAGKSANATVSIASGTTGSIAAAMRGGPRRARLRLVLGRGRFGGARRDHHDQFAGHHRERDRHADRGLARLERQFHQRAGVRRPPVSGLQVRLERLCGYLATGTAGTGTTLTGDGAGGIVEVDAALKNRWDNYRLSPDTMWVSSQVAQNLRPRSWPAGSTRRSASCSTPIRARSAAA